MPPPIPCKDCGQWLSYIVANGRMVPVEIDTYEKHNCSKSKYALRKESTIRAKSASISAIKRIDDFDYITEAQDYIEHVNRRLSSHILELKVIQKEGEEF